MNAGDLASTEEILAFWCCGVGANVAERQMSGISERRFGMAIGLSWQEQLVICEGMLIFRYKVVNNSTKVVKAVPPLLQQDSHPPRILSSVHH